MSQAIIYGVREVGQSQPFYVGSTRQSLSRRWSSHKQSIKGNHRDSHFARRCRLIGIRKLEIFPIETVPASAQFDREHQIINEHLRAGVELTNIRLTPYPAQSQKFSNATEAENLARTIVLALTAPEKCEVFQNQALYSALRLAARTYVRELLTTHVEFTKSILRTGASCQAK